MTDAHARAIAQVLEDQEVTRETGLSAAEAERRHLKYGPNRLRRAKRKALITILLDQIRSIIVWLLAGAAALAFAFGETAEGVAILVVLALNTAIGFATELKAVRSMEALRRLSHVPAKVVRDGAAQVIPAERLVPGDIVLLEAGDVVSADLRLVEAANLQCDESTLTGESAPVAKGTDPVAPRSPLHDRRSMAFSGTAVTSGSGAGIAVATGMNTELGHISALVEEAKAERSPLEERLDRLAGQLVWATLALAAMITFFGVITGKDILVMITTGVALAVAAVPEGLPVVATMALARGMWRMARRNALIERLSAVETLGATTMVLVDKTGTLTENRMSLVALILADGTVSVGRRERGDEAAFTSAGDPVKPTEYAPLRLALETGMLCNNAALSEGPSSPAGPAPDGVGDPMELALLAAGRKAGFDPDALADKFPEVREEAFSTETNMMATFHRRDDGYLVAVKGAPEAVLARCSRVIAREGTAPLDEDGRQAWLHRNHEAAGEGLRLIALATKTVSSSESDPYDGLTLIGLAGLLDPLRPDAKEAVAACRNAGVNVAMLTGDQAATARKIALDVGLIDDKDAGVVEMGAIRNFEDLSEGQRTRMLEARVFARISPEAKLALVTLHQKQGAVVAMTGDGVNDAPALKKADIGIAMGLRGTQVAREAAAIVLKDDSFPSIVAAMHQGRVIFGNIRRFVIYLLSCNLAEILVIGAATLSGLPLPLLPLQILYLNLITDVFPAFALGIGEGDAEVMRRPPRDPGEALVEKRHWLAIVAYGALITLATLAAFLGALVWLDKPTGEAVTVSFLSLALAQLWHVFNMAGWRSPVLANDVTRNPFVWGALVLCVGLTLAAVYSPGLSSILALSAPGADSWLLILGASLAPLVAVQLIKAVAAAWGGSARRGLPGLA